MSEGMAIGEMIVAVVLALSIAEAIGLLMSRLVGNRRPRLALVAGAVIATLLALPTMFALMTAFNSLSPPPLDGGRCGQFLAIFLLPVVFVLLFGAYPLARMLQQRFLPDIINAAFRNEATKTVATSTTISAEVNPKVAER
jgi:Zn-dependent protease